MKNKNKTKDKTAELKRQIKSLQEQVTSQGDIIQAISLQLSEIMRDSKEKETTGTSLMDSATGGIDVGELCSVVVRLGNDVQRLNERHDSCQSLRKTVDELGALLLW